MEERVGGCGSILPQGKAAQSRGMLCGCEQSTRVRITILSQKTNNKEAYYFHNTAHRNQVNKNHTQQQSWGRED